MIVFPQEVSDLALLPKPQVIARWAINAGVNESEESLSLQPRKVVLAKIALAYGASGTVAGISSKWGEAGILALIGDALGVGSFDDLAQLPNRDILTRIYEAVSSFSVDRVELSMVDPMFAWAMVAYDASVTVFGYDDGTDSGFMLYDDGTDSGEILFAA